MIPKGSYILPLKPGTKVPATPNGHHDAVLAPSIGRPNGNYGIRLDDQYAVVDIDTNHEGRQELESLCEGTWCQRTSREDCVGLHYLFRLPEGFKGKNTVYLAGDGKRIADVKAKGYIVGPRSVVNDREYTVLKDVDPQPAPPWLLELLEAKVLESSSVSSSPTDGVPAGSHDHFLHNLSSWLRGKWALSEEAIFELLHKGPLAALEGANPDDPYSESDLRRIAHSSASYAPEKELQLVEDQEWKSFLEIDTEKPIKRWHLYGFIPKGELVLEFGKGGIGKSSWKSYLALDSIKKGKKFGFCGTEEPFDRFGIRAFMAEKTVDRTLLSNLINIGNQWQFPRDGDKLREKLIEYPLDIIYFDSIYSHFEPVEGANMAERTRTCLSPLASIAQELGVTIIGTFHENKNGDFLGSVEMVNVARIVLKSTREKNGPFKIKVFKTNFREPDYSLNMKGDFVDIESLNGNPWLEEDEDGNIVPDKLFVVTGYEKSTGEFDFSEIEDPEESEDPIQRQIRELLSRDPSLGRKRLAEIVGITEKQARARLEKIYKGPGS